MSGLIKAALAHVAKELGGAAAKAIGEKVGEVVGHRLAGHLKKQGDEPRDSEARKRGAE